MERTERGPTLPRKRPVHQPRARDQIPVSQRAVAVKKGVESARMSRKPISGIDLLTLSPYKQSKAATTHKGERRTSTKRESARTFCAWLRTLGMLGEVDPVERSSEGLPLYSFLRSRPNRNLKVRGRFFLSMPCLITLLDNAVTPAVLDRVQGDPCPNENAEPSAAADEKESGWKSTALATAKLLLRGVRDSADAFGPLKSVAGGLCFILENCEVWHYPFLHYHDSDRYPSE